MDSQKALVVEGGAMRGIFASGVLDAFLQEKYNPFDFVMGVSAGASNLVGYLSNQPKRSYTVISELATSKAFYNPGRFLRGGSLVDVRWLIDEANQRYPIDEETLFSSVPFYAAATNVETGKANYYRVTPDNLATAIEATSALPIVYKSMPCVKGDCYTDGGIADSIPVREVYRRGARDITVILSRPLSFSMPKPKSEWMMTKLFARYPQLAHAINHRYERYNGSLEFIKHPPKDVNISVIAPPNDFKVKRLTMKRPMLDEGYQMGFEAGNHFLDSIKALTRQRA